MHIALRVAHAAGAVALACSLSAPKRVVWGIHFVALVTRRILLQTWGALSPRSRSTNQKAQIATNERANIPPHARNVDETVAAMTLSNIHPGDYCFVASPLSAT